MPALRTGMPLLSWYDPREATRLLRYALHRAGFTHTYQSNGNGMSVLSVSAELTVWCRSGSFAWKEEGAVVTHPADDPPGAALLITRHFRRPAAEDQEDQEDRERMTGHRFPTDSPRERTA